MWASGNCRSVAREVLTATAVIAERMARSGDHAMTRGYKRRVSRGSPMATHSLSAEYGVAGESSLQYA